MYVYQSLDDSIASELGVSTQTYIEKIEKTNLVDKNYMSYKNYFQWFIVAAVLVLLIELIFPERKFEK